VTEPKPNPTDVLIAAAEQFARTKNEADGIEVLEAGVKQYLAELDDKQFAALVGEVREPESDALTRGRERYKQGHPTAVPGTERTNYAINR